MAPAAKPKFVVAGGITLLAVTVWVVWSLWQVPKDGETASLHPEDDVLVAQGRGLYAQHCASCHGAGLEGQPNWRQRKADGKLPAPPHDASGHTWHHPDQQLFQLTKFGPATLAGGDYSSDMPAYEQVLSDREIIAVLSYIKSTWPAEIQYRQDRTNQVER